MATGHLTNEEHAELAEWADELYRERAAGDSLPICPECKLLRDNEVTLKFRHGNIHRDPIAWGQNRKCPECYYLHGFGVPMTEDEFEKTKEKMDGQLNYNGKPIEDVQSKEVKERLSDLGYLEM